MLDSIYYMALKLIKNHIFGLETSIFLHLLHDFIMDVIRLCCEICKPLVVYRFYCMVLYLSQMQCHVIKYPKFPLYMYWNKKAV